MPRRFWLILVLFSLSLFVVKLGSERTLTIHEAHFAEVAREMLATGDWVVPRIAGEPWLEKPPLPHWIIAPSVWLFGGTSEFAVRLPSALIGLCGVLLIAALTARWFGPAHGLLTGLIQATTVYTVTYARLAEADIYLWLPMVACYAIFAWNHVGKIRMDAPAKPVRWYNGPAMFLFLLGLTQMAKGPLFGVVLVLLPCIGFLAWERRWSAWRWFVSWPGLLLFVAVSVAWPAAILIRYPDTWDLWWLHTFGRFGDQCLNPRPWWYYFSTVPWQVLPWTLFLLPAILGSLTRAWHGKVATPETGTRQDAAVDRFLWLWFLLPLAVLSLVKAKHHHYLIHSLPPCSIWAASGLLHLHGSLGRMAMRQRLFWQSWGIGATATTGGIACCYFAYSDFLRDAIVLGTLVLAGSGLILAACIRQRVRFALAVTFAICWISYGYVHASLMRRTDRYRDETAFLRRLNGPEHVGTHLLVYAYDPSRVLLYCELPVELYMSPAALRGRYEQLSQAYLLTSLAQADDFESVAEIACVDKMARRRWQNLGPLAQLGAFRLTWRPPRNSAISAHSAAHSP